jgi:hypothetical protein
MAVGVGFDHREDSRTSCYLGQGLEVVFEGAKGNFRPGGGVGLVWHERIPLNGLLLFKQKEHLIINRQDAKFAKKGKKHLGFKGF